MTNIKILERTIVWLNDIADMCQRLTTGNVSHLGATIRGKAVRAAEFINKHKEVYVSTELKEIAHKVQEATWKDTSSSQCSDIAYHEFINGANWQKDRMTIKAYCWLKNHSTLYFTDEFIEAFCDYIKS